MTLDVYRGRKTTMQQQQQQQQLSSRLPERGRKKRETIGETEKLSEQHPTRTYYCKYSRLLPYYYPNWKLRSNNARRQKESEIRKQVAKCVCKTKLMHSSYAYSQTPLMEPPSTCLKKK